MIQERMDMILTQYSPQDAPGAYTDHKQTMALIGPFNAYIRTVKAVQGGPQMDKTIRIYTEKAGVKYGDIIGINGETYRVESSEFKNSLHSTLAFYQIEAVRIYGVQV